MSSDEFWFMFTAFFVITTFFGIIGYWIASSKGQGPTGFLLGFLLGPIGLIISALLQPAASHVRSPQSGLKACPSCAELIQPQAKKCRFCGDELPSDFSIGSIPFIPGVAFDSPEMKEAQQYGITHNGSHYIVAGMKFAKIRHAIEYAKKAQSK